MGNSPSYSLLDDMEFKTSFGKPMEQLAPQAQQESFISPGTAQAAARGAQGGGLSGALMSGGTAAMLGAESGSAAMAGGGPWAIAGGLLLSELQAAQEAKARQEAEMIANEKNKNQNMQNQLNQSARTVFRV